MMVEQFGYLEQKLILFTLLLWLESFTFSFKLFLQLIYPNIHYFTLNSILA